MSGADPVGRPTEASGPEGCASCSDNEVATDCGLHDPGHMPHHIQVVRALREVDEPAIVCVLVEARTDGVVTRDAGGTIHRVWNHEPRRLSRLAAEGGAVRLSRAWNLLSIDHPGGSFGFSVDFDHLAGGKPCEATPVSG